MDVLRACYLSLDWTAFGRQNAKAGHQELLLMPQDWSELRQAAHTLHY